VVVEVQLERVAVVVSQVQNFRSCSVGSFVIVVVRGSPCAVPVSRQVSDVAQTRRRRGRVFVVVQEKHFLGCRIGPRQNPFLVDAPQRLKFQGEHLSR
jgi:hypothetical protein